MFPDLEELTSFEDLLRNYRVTLRRLSELGVRIAPNSRLRIYEEKLAQATANESSQARLDELYELAFYLREADEIVQIVHSLPDYPDKPLHVKLAKLDKGTVHPDKERGSPGRDNQYELYLYAILRAAGVPTYVGEPDLTIRLCGNTYSIEAKRPKSKHTLDKRLREALSQLESRPSRGLVALSLDMVLRPKQHHLEVVAPEELPQAMDSLFLEYLDWLLSSGSPVARRVREKNAVGLILTARIPSFVRKRGLISMASRHELIYLVDEADPHNEHLGQLRSAMSSFVPK